MFGNINVAYNPANGWNWESSSKLEDLTAIGNLVFTRKSLRASINLDGNEHCKNRLVISSSKVRLIACSSRSLFLINSSK